MARMQRSCGGVIQFLLTMAFAMVAFAADLPLPALTGRVIDRAEILSPAAEASLSARIEAHENATTDQIVIVTLPDLMGRPIEDWGLMLGREWGIGRADKNNGIVFLIAPNDRQLRIEVGYGLEGSLPDARAAAIIQSDVIPHFKQGDMEAGIDAGLEAILATLSGTYQPATSPRAERSGGYAPIIDALVPLFFFGTFVCIGILMSLRRRWDDKRKRHVWYIAKGTGSGSGSRSFGRSGGGFSGRGGSFGGGGASGRW